MADPEQCNGSRLTPLRSFGRDIEPEQHSHDRRKLLGVPPSKMEIVANLPVASWMWFLTCMTTLALSTLLSDQRSLHDFHGLYTIGLVVYFVGLVEFVILIIIKGLRFFAVKHSLRRSLDVPEEAMFFATFWISCYGTIAGAVSYSEPHPGSRLSTALVAFFWIYLVFAILAATVGYLVLFHERELQGRNMTPAWLLPILPVVLIGVLGGDLIGHATIPQIYSIQVAGTLCASMGFLLSLPIAAIYLLRLFTAGFPEPDLRPGMMIAVGPPSYASLAYLKLASGVPEHYGFFATHPGGKDVVETLALLLSIGFFGMASFFLIMAVCSISRRASRMTFHITWYSLIFPNVGFFSTMGIIGVQLPSNGVTWVATAGNIILSALWLMVSFGHLKAIFLHSANLH